MPRTPTDYSKSVIYKIEHLEKPELVYVGSTTNFTKRKYQHKYICENESSKKYNIKLYQLIREHGNWESFKIMIICDFPCNNKTELLIEEEKYRKELKANLNSCKSIRTFEEYIIQKTKCDKEYYIKNKDKLKKKMADYNNINKEKLKEKAKDYYNNNKKHITEYKKQTINCLCGTICGISHKSRHEKSVKHCEFIKQIV